MRIVRVLASICAVVALVLACVTGDPSASLAGDDYNDDVPAAPDLSTALPAARAEPELALAAYGPVFVARPAPTSRQNPLDIFRPPRALG